MSKILLLGEYSGLHKNLKEGLIELGHEVIIASSGDGKKRIINDIDLTLKSPGKITKIFELQDIISKFKNFDIVQFINPYVSHKLGVFLYNSIFQDNDKVFCTAAGDDVEFVKMVLSKGLGKYSPFDEYLELGKKLDYSSNLDTYLHKRFMKRLDGIIPVMWEYAESYRRSNYADKLFKTIPLPINLTENEFQDNKLEKKLVFYHASNRPLFKGSKIIIDAMKIFQEMYPNDVEMIYADFLPLNEYLEVIKKANVIIDQCRSYSYGMNAVYGMAKGKIVMSGSENESLLELGVESSPIINITPNVNQIINEFKKLLDLSHNITEFGNGSREYVEKVHDHIIVSNLYKNTWNLID